MLGPAKLSPSTRRIEDLADRVKRLQAFEAWGQPEPLDIESIINSEQWATPWRNLEAIISLMREAQAHAEKLRERLIPSCIDKHPFHRSDFARL